MKIHTRQEGLADADSNLGMDRLEHFKINQTETYGISFLKYYIKDIVLII